MINLPLRTHSPNGGDAPRKADVYGPNSEPAKVSGFLNENSSQEFSLNNMAGDGVFKENTPHRTSGPSFNLRAVSERLRALNYPEKSIKSLLRCGNEARFAVLKTCKCGTEAVEVKYRCNLRTCERCSKFRKRRIYAQYLPLFQRHKSTRNSFYQFLTISPQNYSTFSEGERKIKQNFKRFLRLQYIRDNVEGGFWVMETKQTWKGKSVFDKKGRFLYVADKDGWNIHLHIVLFGKWLDNVVRGHCFDCGQNYLKWSKDRHCFRCGNRKCRSFNVKRKEGTIVQNLWNKSNKEKAIIYGERCYSSYGAVSYLTKYISSNKDDFKDEESLALYINGIHHKRAIMPFGSFYHFKLEKLSNNFVCPVCKTMVVYEIDVTFSNEYYASKFANFQADVPDRTRAVLHLP